MSVFVGDIANVSIIGHCYAQRVMLTLWYRCTIASGVETIFTSMNDLATALDTGGTVPVFDRYMNCLQADYSSSYVQTQVIKPVRTAYFRKVSVVAGAGGAGTVANDSAALTVRTDESGRGKQGTKHIGPIADGSSLDGFLTGAFLGDLSDLADALLLGFTIPTKATTWKPILYHRADGSYTNLSNAGLGYQSRVQRRRTVSLGE